MVRRNLSAPDLNVAGPAAAALRRGRRFARGGVNRPEPPMPAIYAIVVFLVVLLALNKFEFGRLD